VSSLVFFSAITARCWNDAGTMLERCWNAATMLERCWSDADDDAGTMPTMPG